MDKLAHLCHYSYPLHFNFADRQRMHESITIVDDLFSKTNLTIDAKLISDDLFQKKGFCRKAKTIQPAAPNPAPGPRGIVFHETLGETIRSAPVFTIKHGNCFNNHRVVLAENEPEIRVVLGKIYQK
ncbi:hypothetical protein [Dehalogenimonas etheniformans]|uniref:Uncharacterized protein n=1 Tax=Dehalogenimonas etheniformans TaxID=1536648 RepID=A0A2P5P4Q9_9CHLR|nr:hypothetical protein [Dehalogenimonas etheniformans]PPD57281.1 hypothetical protein JP09_009530 [Dehalogenimonas etheniformans]QNT76997.1 hypothetical protein HX448_10085 [Dehalogenimonas etheniformans]